MSQGEFIFADTERLKTMSDAVCVVIDNYPKGRRFFGNQLHNDVAALCPQFARMYPDTMLRMMRRHRRAFVRTIDQNRSLYEKV